MGLGTVVISLYRPAFDDFLVSTVHGSDDARTRCWARAGRCEQWTPLLDPAFERHGCFFLPWDQFDWSQDGRPSYVPEFEPVDDPEAWHPEDALFVPLRHHLGGLLGFLSVDEPASGAVRPTRSCGCSPPSPPTPPRPSRTRSTSRRPRGTARRSSTSSRSRPG